MIGFVKSIVQDRGFGFIAHGDGDQPQETFFHLRDLHPSLEFGEQLREQRVEFEITTDTRSGRLRASNVRAA